MFVVMLRYNETYCDMRTPATSPKGGAGAAEETEPRPGRPALGLPNT